MAWSQVASGIYWNGNNKQMKFRARIVAQANGSRRDHYGPHRDTRAEAEADLAGLKKDYQDGGAALLDAKRVTFAELAKEYSDVHLKPPKYIWSDDKRKQRKISGVAGYKNGLHSMQLFVEYFGKRLIKSIKDEDIRRWKEQRYEVPKERGGGQRTEANINRTLDWLRQTFNYAVKQGYLAEHEKPNVASFMHMDMELQRDRKLNEDEEACLLTAANEHLKPILIFLLDSGVRPSEAQRLRREHIKLNEGKYGHLYLSADITKSKKRRNLPIFTARSRQVLIEQLATVADGPSALVFGRWDIRNGLEFAAACEAAEISDFRLHDCRRTWASKAVNALPIAQVMRYGGWDKPETLMRYVRTDQDMDDSNVERFEEYLYRSVKTTVPVSEQVN